MPDFIQAHAALFDELERQGIYCADVVKLTLAVMGAQTIVEQAKARSDAACRSEPRPRCEVCE
ncbi:MAG: hypothetical protein AB7S70_01870 [Hyphomicrobium sp.]|jgi:hypothetical protein